MKGFDRGAIYKGIVTHRRLRPMGHRFRYRTYSLLVDIDGLDELATTTPLLSHNRWNLYAIYDRDFGPRDGSPLRPWMDHQLATAGIDLDGGSIQLLFFPRMLGYAFNPLTIWYCYHSDGTLRAVLHEIHNTFGQHHSHLVPVDRETGEPLRHSFAKELHVSPFFDQAGTYTFTLRPPGDRLSVSIDYRVADQRMLKATMAYKRGPLTTRSLLWAFVSHPLLTMKVTTGIHWNALRLWLKGAKYRPVPEAPPNPVSFVATFEEAS
jgi:DUF1365 family protein